MDEMTLGKLVTFCDALSNPLRVRILKMLLEKEWYIYELAKELGVSRQLLYLHLRKLESAGLVESDLRLEKNELRAKKYYRAKRFKVTLDDELIRNLEV
jgi:predicted transcriptional regulator